MERKCSFPKSWNNSKSIWSFQRWYRIYTRNGIFSISCISNELKYLWNFLDFCKLSNEKQVTLNILQYGYVEYWKSDICRVEKILPYDSFVSWINDEIKSHFDLSAPFRVHIHLVFVIFYPRRSLLDLGLHIFLWLSIYFRFDFIDHGLL